MPYLDVVREIDIPQSFRVAQIVSMFDVPLTQKLHKSWQVNLPIDVDDWQIGVIVGPSGCGKSSIAQSMWPEQYTRGYAWNDASILDNFPAELGSKVIINALTSVGFSSPPDWIKPYGALSTGQQMRADLARALISATLVVFDEFTSVVDRTVAQVGSAAIAKAIRKQPGRQFIAVTCHADVVAWLEPDWVYEPHTALFQRRSQRRPSIDISISRCHSSAWPLFKDAHYLSADLNPSASCYIAEWNGVPIAFVAVLPMIGFKNAYRISRVVVLPDYQGIGVGSRLSAAIGDLYRNQGKRLRITTSHPGMIASMNHSTRWALCGDYKNGTKTPGRADLRKGHKTTGGRAIITFEYMGAV